LDFTGLKRFFRKLFPRKATNTDMGLKEGFGGFYASKSKKGTFGENERTTGLDLALVLRWRI